jgi:glycine cleavage system H protein
MEPSMNAAADIPNELKYADSHEWVRDHGDGTVTVGISQFAQDHLGELVYVELPDPGRKLKAGEPCAVVESTKAASDVYAPVTGEVIEVNTALGDAPQTVNSAPYGDGWLIKIRLEDRNAPALLLDAGAYAKLVAAQS